MRPVEPDHAHLPAVAFRLGSVPYLNARPLIDSARDNCSFAVPSMLAREFSEGRYDAALLPAFEAARRDHAWIADGACIASNGPVFSVFLAHREPLESLESIALDPASRTSSHLLQLIMGEFLGLDPDFTASPATPDEPRLLIGDPAIEFRTSRAATGWQFLDLGEAWKNFTGLPFVFAVWVIDQTMKSPTAVARHLRAMKSAGVQNIPHIASGHPNPEFALQYLTKNICYDLDDSSKESLRLYAALLRKSGLVPATPENSLQFI